MKKIKDWMDRWIPKIWGVMLVILITATITGAAIWSVRWLLTILGVL